MEISISRKSWLYRFAYCFTSKDKRPAEGDLCHFAWRLVFMVLGGVLLVGLAPFYGVGLIVTFLIGLLFGTRPSPGAWGNLEYVTFSRWPKIRVGEGEIVARPIYFLLLALAIWFLFFTFHGRLVLGFMALIGLGILWDSYLCRRGKKFWFFGETDGATLEPGILTLAREFIKAKKQKYCPKIRFV